MIGAGLQYFNSTGSYAAKQSPENLEPRLRSHNRSWLGIAAGIILIAGVGMIVVFDLMPQSKQVEIITSEAVACEISDRKASYDLSTFATDDGMLEGFERFNVDLDLEEAGSRRGHTRLEVQPGGFDGLAISRLFGHGVSPTCRLTIYGIK